MFLKRSIRSGFGFGLTSGIITTLGVIIGLNSGLNSRKAVIGGILIIAIADAFSDALGIHIAEEAENRQTTREIWESTISTLVSKFVVAITFLVPMLIFPLTEAIIISIVWGLSLLSAFSFYIAKDLHEGPWKVVMEHLIIAVAVIILTHFIGLWITPMF